MLKELWIVAIAVAMSKTPREWICAGPWAIPANFYHARHRSLRFPATRLIAAAWAQEGVSRCGGCNFASGDAMSPPLFKGDWVSLKYKFWFRRTPKCGQTSVSQLFQSCQHSLDLRSNVALSSAAGRFETSDFKYIALVRDPIDRFCSGYHELWSRLAALNISRSKLRHCLRLEDEPTGKSIHHQQSLPLQGPVASEADGCVGVDIEDPTVHALASSAFFDWPIDFYAERTMLAVLDEIDRVAWPGNCTSEMRAHARSLNHLFPQAWLIGRAAAQAIVGREVYVGSKLGAWPDIVLRTESLESDLSQLLHHLNVSSAECPVQKMPHLNRLASDASGLDMNRSRVRKILLKAKVARRFCRIFAIDFLYLGYEDSWQKYCARVLAKSLDVRLQGRLVSLDRFSRHTKRRGRQSYTQAPNSWRLHWKT